MVTTDFGELPSRLGETQRCVYDAARQRYVLVPAVEESVPGRGLIMGIDYAEEYYRRRQLLLLEGVG